ncbi:hypothetical protein NDU88_005095, partial [Pleurodeles waltl]
HHQCLKFCCCILPQAATVSNKSGDRAPSFSPDELEITAGDPVPVKEAVWLSRGT